MVHTDTLMFLLEHLHHDIVCSTIWKKIEHNFYEEWNYRQAIFQQECPVNPLYSNISVHVLHTHLFIYKAVDKEKG